MGRECPPEAIRKSVATRTAFIEKELPEWVRLYQSGLSAWKVSVKFGRCSRVVKRELMRVLGDEYR